MINGVSIIVCCYNSASRISETLQHIFKLIVPESLSCEILLIDNCSTDNTQVVAGQVNKEFNHKKIDFRIIEERNPGLSEARKRGVAESKYDLLLFCDDDNHLDDDYLIAAVDIFIRNLEVGIVGGWCKPKLPFYPGKWIEANYTALACEPSPGKERFVDWVFGAGMVVRKRVFSDLQINGIRLLLSDRIGLKQASGGDAEICRLARFLGYKVYYSPDLILHHSISSNRLTRWSFIRANYRNVYLVVYFFSLDKIINDPGVPFKKIYDEFVKSRIQYIIYYLPRILVGNNTFFSFLMFYQNVQLILWVLFRQNQFTQTYYKIKNNLYINA
jgi:glycosyltransferase involved in cell wall biosynthesis